MKIDKGWAQRGHAISFGARHLSDPKLKSLDCGPDVRRARCRKRQLSAKWLCSPLPAIPPSKRYAVRET
jgi:hypothetical protein